MDDIKQDVVAESSPAQEVVKEIAEQPAEQQPTAVETSESQASSPMEVKDEGEVDEKGIPYKNRFMEYQRKYTEAERRLSTLETNLPEIIQNAVKGAIPAQQAEPKYSKEQLIQFKNSTDDVQHRVWAETELEKLRTKEIEEIYTKQFTQREQKERVAREQNEAFNAVRNKYGVMFNPDGSWNNNHPLTQEMGRIYQSRDAFKNDGYGLLAAADIAFSNYALSKSPDLARKEIKLKREVKKLQKATLVEGSGSAEKPQANSMVKTLKDRYFQSGKPEDLSAWQRELNRVSKG